MKKGFTLIELLAVIIVLGMVIALALPGVNKIIESSEKRTFIADANFIIESVRNKVKAGEYIGIEGSNEVLRKLGFYVEKEGTFKKSGTDIIYDDYTYRLNLK